MKEKKNGRTSWLQTIFATQQPEKISQEGYFSEQTFLLEVQMYFVKNGLTRNSQQTFKFLFTNLPTIFSRNGKLNKLIMAFGPTLKIQVFRLSTLAVRNDLLRIILHFQTKQKTLLKEKCIHIFRDLCSQLLLYVLESNKISILVPYWEICFYFSQFQIISIVSISL